MVYNIIICNYAVTRARPRLISKETAFMRSMTAFGRAAGTYSERHYEVVIELRSVNNRYLDWNIRLPRAYAALEDRIKSTLGKAGISRGKLDVFVTLTDTRYADTAGNALPQRYEPDVDAARGYADAAARLAAELGMENDLTVSRLLKLPGVMVPVKEADEALTDDEIWALILPVAEEAAAQFLDARSREGARLGDDLLSKLSGVREMVAEIAARSEENIRTHRARFEERLRSFISDATISPDENRILTECAVYADKVAIDEELVRLGSHFDALEALFRSDEAVGRRIDFLLQETNREVNTIGSKCSDAAMAQKVADIKSELEKIREQIQNIE